MANKPEVPEIETTGHEWDGIKEYNNPLPRWWLWTFYITIIWGIGYTIAYPAWPLINGVTQGVIGYSTRAEVAKEIQAFSDANAAIDMELASADLSNVADNPDLYRYAINAGGAVFLANCSQCHGAGGQGAKGYPNLNDDDWLWGGTVDEIAYTVNHGVRNDSDDAHFSQMPAFGELLEESEISAVVQHVLSISGQDHDASKIALGAEVYADNCAACHAEDGTGDRSQGAPNLADRIWLFGGDPESIAATVTNSRFGVMPAWGERLTDSQVNSVAIYVHQLGGGE
ncbi:MAG: cytochrome-c oxidase, cbb3-type subunit III [Paracoccaceae bacterium]|nr:cytochrome-c oxidase, cbb3-type subunit III [Paracoccaceae bacterium]